MSQLVLSGHRVDFITLPANASAVSAGNFTGNQAVIGNAGGTSLGRTRVKQIRVSVLGPDFPNENYLRIYKYHTPTNTHYLIRSEYLAPTKYASMAGGFVPPVYVIRFPHDGIADEILYSPDYKLSFQLEAIPSHPLLVETVLADYALS